MTTTNETDFAEALRQTAMLVTCSISKWNVRISDREAARDLNLLKEAKAGATEVKKNLLAGADAAYKDLCSTLDAARTSVHYKLTLPWVTSTQADHKGPRLLPNVHFDRYAASMHKQKQLANEQKEKFLAAYPDLIAAAKANLGQMAQAHDYPSVADVSRRFGITLDFQPIPAGSEFRGLPENTLLALSNHMAQRTQSLIANAIGDVWLRVREKVAHLIERLEPVTDEETKRFHSTVVTNITDVVELMHGFNITNDERVAAIQQELADMLAGVTADTLRDDSNIRDEVRAKAIRVRDKLAAWGV